MILTFLSGGTAPFVQYQPLVINTARASGGESSSKDSSSSSSKNDGKITQKDLLTMLKDIDGLPSDMEELYGNMINFMRMGEVYGREIDTSMLATQFILSLRDIKTAVFRKGIFEKAYDLVEKNGGMHEVAITKDGKVIGRNKDGKLDAFSLEEFDGSEYTPVTNAELLRIRANDPNYAGNDYLSEIASNGIGLDLINKLIYEYITSLGKSTISSLTKSTDDLEIGANYLYQLALAGVDLSEFDGNKILTENLTKLALYALNYIMTMLPKNAQTLLEYKSKQYLNVTPALLVYNLIESKMSDKINLGDILSGKGNTDKNGKFGSGDFTSDLYTNIVRGKGYSSKSVFVLRDSNGFTMQVTGKSYPYIQNHQGDNIGTMTLSKALQEGIGDLYKGGNYAITFGDLILNVDDLHNVLYESDGSALRVILPIKRKDGKIVPDLDLAKENKSLLDKINSNENWMNDQNILQELKNTGLFTDMYGNIDKSKYQTYLVFNSKTDDNVVVPSEWITEINPTKSEINMFSKYLQEDNPDYEFDEYNKYNPFDIILGANKMYRGTLFIPLTENILAAATGALKKYKEPTTHEIDYLYLENEFSRYNKINSGGMERLE